MIKSEVEQCLQSFCNIVNLPPEHFRPSYLTESVLLGVKDYVDEIELYADPPIYYHCKQIPLFTECYDGTSYLRFSHKIILRPSSN